MMLEILQTGKRPVPPSNIRTMFLVMSLTMNNALEPQDHWCAVLRQLLSGAVLRKRRDQLDSRLWSEELGGERCYR